jgi:D-alanyl-D-alanine carboxypeptidase
MLTTLISLYAASALFGSDLPAYSAQTIPWNDSNLLSASEVPQKKPENIAPVIKAKSAIAVDLKTGYILFEKNIYETLPIASLTKLMTVTIVLEESDLKDVATISTRTAATPGSKIWLAPSEKITVENLLNAALINSANDAAMALAEYNSGNIEAFVEKMNLKSKELGLYSTFFINPTGLDSETKKTGAAAETPAASSAAQENISSNASPPAPPISNQQTGTQVILPAVNPLLTAGTAAPKDNYSTAYDLSLLGRYAFGKSFVRRTVGKKELEIKSTNEKITHKLKNTNALLDSYLNVLGLKTGTTDEAGECLISVIENDTGSQILTVVLNSKDRYKETKVLADWIFRTYNW